MSPGGVHSKQKHILELKNIADNVETNIHAILDGRIRPKGACDYLGDFISRMPKLSKISSISGRYYAMDRDNRWKEQSFIMKQ